MGADWPLPWPAKAVGAVGAHGSGGGVPPPKLTPHHQCPLASPALPV